MTKWTDLRDFDRIDAQPMKNIVWDSIKDIVPYEWNKRKLLGNHIGEFIWTDAGIQAAMINLSVSL